ncbi:hypothetical protein K458DRAFT_423235 [Lentithecium fluviatile CBS 122367]|uniref:Uncharacterized protein n=1 Tax=Lentithecium fluviatile CBS 122367 TaxID=1168545 RepID=A0A6G1IK76_9PLEO|nr:hypothetical protein K458DRAFT_423235 [Lentithecium fluviatile CBS 122367]
MLRTGASRLALRSIPAPIVRPAASFRVSPPAAQWTTQFGSVASKRPATPRVAGLRPIQSAVLRRAVSNERKKAEERYAHEKIMPTPETVSATSTIHPVLGEVTGESQPPKEMKVSAGVAGDIETIRETFSLKEVPRKALYVGMAGVLPYLATSVSTVACAYEINHSVAGYGYLMSAQTASTILQFLEPLQVGYGAVILSFLGAIHWGFEWAGYGGYQGYPRYAIGILSTAVAWPTLLMPVEYALITQFCAFTLLYNADTRATYRGWTPPWYAMYRFVLTFIVGASIVVSLIGRGEVADAEAHRIPSAVDRIKTLRDDAQEKFAKEEAGILAQQEAESSSKDDDSEE